MLCGVLGGLFCMTLAAPPILVGAIASSTGRCAFPIGVLLEGGRGRGGHGFNSAFDLSSILSTASLIRLRGRLQGDLHFGRLCGCSIEKLSWTCLVFRRTVYRQAEFLTLTQYLGHQTTDSISVTAGWAESNHSDHYDYTDSEPVARLPYSLVPSARPRSANLFLLRKLGCDAVVDWYGGPQWSSRDKRR